MRAILLVILGLAVGLFSLGSSSGTQDQLPCTVTVQPGESIQAAIDAAEEGTVVCLAEGTWEENIEIGKGLTLRGLGPEKSVIKGAKEKEPVILITSNTEIEATVEGLTLAEAKGWRCAERPLRCPNGLSLGGKVKATIRGNTISGNGYGISMEDSAQASIEGNTISGNGGPGIRMEDSAQATIEENTILGNWDGIYMRASAQASIEGNTISGNKRVGISMKESAQASIEGNTISRNSWYGIFMLNEAQAEVENNTIQENRGCGISAFSQAKVSGTSNHLETNGADLCGNLPASLRIPLVPEAGEAEIEFPGKYETLQEVIDALAPGGTIVIAPGEHQGGLTIWKPLTLKGPGSERGTLKGRTGEAPVISIIPEAKDVKVEGLAITQGYDGLLVYGQATIEENAISGNEWDGIGMGGTAQASIEENTISGNWYGISMEDSAQASIEGNTISGNRGDGISVWDSAQASIEENTISGNKDDGISIWDSAQASIAKNTISGNEGDGISMLGTAQANIEKNTISENRHGIYMLGSAQANIEGNKIAENDGYGVWLYQRPCWDTAEKFEGAVRGRVNEISGNKEGEVCPAELAFLMTEAGGCYGPKC